MEERTIPARDFGRLRTIFDRAIELPAGEQRHQFLAEACAGVPGLLAQVEGLLSRDAVLNAREAGSLPRFGAYQATRQLDRSDVEFERRVAIKVLPTGTVSHGYSAGLDPGSDPATLHA